MQLISKKNVLIALSIILVAVMVIIAFRADQPGVVAPAENWEAVIQQADAYQETVLITTKEVRLEADLFVPNGGENPKPAVVFITGSGDTVYQNYGEGLIEPFVLNIFLPRDMSVLLVNKRGMGQSSGSWLNNDFQGRADDIYAAVEYLQGLEDMDPSNIGVMGHSQGGWIANLVAAQHDDVAFFISLAGPTTTVETQMQDTYQNVFACEGSEGDELDRRTKNQLRLTRLGASIGSLLPFGVIGFDASIIDYDPEDALRTAEQPGLFAFGEYDPFVPPESSQQRVGQLFGNIPPENLTFVTISQANHRFKVVDSMCVSPDIASSAKFSEQLTAEMREWLNQIGYPHKEVN